MAYRIIKPTSAEPTESVYTTRPLPVDQAWAGYARQSTTRQLEENPESTAMQTKGLLKRALQLSYREELGTLYQEGNGVRGVSGQLRIDQRGDLSTVDARIRADEVKTVFILNEGRLFRDTTGIQYTTFAETCRQHDCRVVTPRHIYDFSRREDYKMWCQRCEAEADYLAYHIPMMHDARKQAALRGKKVSGRIAVGYLVSGDYKVVVFEPHAKVVRWLFKRYRELDGKLNRLAREIKGKAIFPAADVKLNLKRAVRGWTITRDGLAYLLSNPIYIGYHMVNGVVVDKQHHIAIVDLEDFMYAFNRLSRFDLDGKPQERIGVRTVTRKGKPVTWSEGGRYQRVTTEPKSALLTDRITSNECPVFVNRAKGLYVVSKQSHGMHEYSASIKLTVLDAVFSQHFTYVVKQDVKKGDGKALAVLNAQTSESSVPAQLEQAHKEVALLRAKMDATDDVELVKKWNTKLRELNELVPRLERILAKQDEALKTVEEYETLLDRIRGRWNSMVPEAKQKAVNALIEQVVLTKKAPHWYQLEVYWKIPVGRVDVGYIWYQRGGGFIWTPEEDAAIKALYPTEDRETVQKALSRRAWYAIGDRAYQKRVRRLTASSATIPEHVSWEDWTFQREHELTSEAGSEYRATWRTKTRDKSASFRRSSDRCL